MTILSRRGRKVEAAYGAVGDCTAPHSPTGCFLFPDGLTYLLSQVSHFATQRPECSLHTRSV